MIAIDEMLRVIKEGSGLVSRDHIKTKLQTLKTFILTITLGPLLIITPAQAAKGAAGPGGHLRIIEVLVYNDDVIKQLVIVGEDFGHHS